MAARKRKSRGGAGTVRGHRSMPPMPGRNPMAQMGNCK